MPRGMDAFQGFRGTWCPGGTWPSPLPRESMSSEAQLGAPAQPPAALPPTPGPAPGPQAPVKDKPWWLQALTPDPVCSQGNA